MLFTGRWFPRRWFTSRWFPQGTIPPVVVVPDRTIQVLSRDDTTLNVLSRDDTTVSVRSNIHMAVTQRITCNRGEDVALNGRVVNTGADISGWTLVWQLLDRKGGAVLAQLVEGDGITVTSGTEYTISIPSAITDREPDEYFYLIGRANTGNLAILTQGPFEINPSDASML